MTAQWRVLLVSSAQRELRALREPNRFELLDLILSLAENPFPSDSSPLEGRGSGL